MQCAALYTQWGTLKTRDWKTQDWKTWDQIAGVEKAGLENAGTSCAWVAKCNIINVRGHVRVNVTAGRGAFLGHLQRTTVTVKPM